MKIVCIVPQLSQPRCIKRIKALIAAGYEVEVFGCDNNLYSDNIKDIKCPIYSWKILKNSSKSSLIYQYFSLVKQAVNRLTNKSDCLYIFGIKCAFYYYLLLRPYRYIYEQADLGYTKYKSNFLVLLFKILDKYFIKKSLFTILTSQGFIDYLFDGICPKNVLLIPNKLNKYFNCGKRIYRICNSVDHLRFGFVGLIRYPKTIFPFVKVIAQKYPNHEFHFYGEGQSSNEARELCNRYANVYYHGKFKNPEDLELIYNKLDFSLVCYDPSFLNVRIAEPNKLYESIFFCVPIVVSKGTFLEKKVKKLRIGFSIDGTDESDICYFINSLTVDSINSIYKAMSNIPDLYLFDETSSIIQKIRQTYETNYPRY